MSPFSIELDLLDKYVDCAIEKKLILSTASIETEQLFLHLKEQLDFISVDKRLALLQCEVIVLPFPLCLSYAHELENGRKIIVIANGLINLVANAIFSSHVQSALPPEIDKYYLLNHHGMPVSHLFANAIFLLQLHSYRFCSPLPNLQALLSSKMLQQCREAINGALLFILLHELVHQQVYIDG